MDKINCFMQKLDKVLNEKNAVTDLIAQAEKKTGIPRLNLALGAIAFIALYLIVGYGSHFLCNFIGFLYPAYASIKAIESKAKDDDTQWLIYWVSYSAFGISEVIFDLVLFWIPLYSFLKCGILLYLMAPIQNNGSVLLYHKIIRPYVLKYESQIDSAINQAGDIAGNMVDKAKTEGVKKFAETVSKTD